MHSAIEAYESWHSRLPTETAANVPGKPHVITSNIEHVATRCNLDKWVESGRIGNNFYVILLFGEGSGAPL